MANLQIPFPVQNPSISFGASTLYTFLGSAFSPGVCDNNHFQVVQHAAGSNSTVDVQPGNAFVPSTNGYGGATSDLRFVVMSAVSTNGGGNTDWGTIPSPLVSVFASADSTKPRIDTVVLAVNDSNLDSTGLFTSVLGIVTGTPTTGATLANLSGIVNPPTNTLTLAYVLIPANVSVNITNTNILDARPRAAVGAITSNGFGVASPLGSYQTTTGSLPATPLNGDMVTMQVATNGSLYTNNWVLRYNSQGDTYPWEFIGGTPIAVSQSGSATITGTSYAAFATGTAPSITVPRTGYYRIHLQLQASNGTSGDTVSVVPQSATLAAVVQNGVKITSSAAAAEYVGSGQSPPVLLTQSETLSLQGKVNAGTGTVTNCTMTLTPIAVV